MSYTWRRERAQARALFSLIVVILNGENRQFTCVNSIFPQYSQQLLNGKNKPVSHQIKRGDAIRPWLVQQFYPRGGRATSMHNVNVIT